MTINTDQLKEIINTVLNDFNKTSKYVLSEIDKAYIQDAMVYDIEAITSFPSTVKPMEVAKMHTRMDTLEQENKRLESATIDCDNRNLSLQHCITDLHNEITALNVEVQKYKGWKTKYKRREKELLNMLDEYQGICSKSEQKQPEPCCYTCSGLLWHTIRGCYFCGVIKSHRFSTVIFPSDHCPQYQRKASNDHQ